MINEFSLSSLTLATPFEVRNNESIRISNGRIKDFEISSINNYNIEGNYILFPALINAHDHLFGSYHPKIGDGPYICWLPWDCEMKGSESYKERNKNTPFDIYLLGSYKNLISGVTTVQDHIPHKINNPFIEKLPIRVIKEYSLAHEVSIYDLKWGDGVDIEYKKAVKNNIPFITHIEEGFDEESFRGIDILEDHKALGEYTILIHGIGFSMKDIQAITKAKANFVWCPGSNMFMFNKTAKIKEIINAGINVSIGTDSPASGELNMLEEIRFAKRVYREMYNKELPDDLIVKMITINPAKALRIDDKLGSLENGKLGDMLLISGDKNKPYESLINAKLEDISLVFIEGKPVYGDIEFKSIFQYLGVVYTKISINGKKKLIIGDPCALMKRIRKNVGFHKELPFLPI